MNCINHVVKSEEPPKEVVKSFEQFLNFQTERIHKELWEHAFKGLEENNLNNYCRLKTTINILAYHTEERFFSIAYVNHFNGLFSPRKEELMLRNIFGNVEQEVSLRPPRYFHREPFYPLIFRTP